MRGPDAGIVKKSIVCSKIVSVGERRTKLVMRGNEILTFGDKKFKNTTISRFSKIELLLKYLLTRFTLSTSPSGTSQGLCHGRFQMVSNA